MNFQEDYTQAKRRQDLLRSMFQQNLQPQRRPGLASTLGRALAAYMMSKDMGKADSQMSQAAQGQQDSRKMDMANVLSAYRQDTPYQMDSSELFPGESPIAGLKDMGTGQDRNAMVQAMMATNDPNIQNRGMDAMINMETQGPMSPGLGKYNPGDFTPETWAQFASGGYANPAILKRYESPWVGKVGGGVGIIDKSGGGSPQVTPVTTATEEAIAAAEIAGAQEGAKQEQKLLWGPKIQSAVKEAESLAKERGEVLTDLARAEAAMPGLNDTVAELKELSQIATSTIGGRAWDAIVKESGFGATEGATARAKFIAIVNNQVLPLLKPTFGAAFTVQEGESLKATMGDPNASPEQKMAQLEAFIAQKYRDIQTKNRQLGIEAPPQETINWSDL